MRLNKKVITIVASLLLVIMSAAVFRIFFLGDKKLLYVALGDSVAAGAGLRTASDRSGCDRNDESYPNLLANSREYELKNLACSGATIDKGIMGSQKVEDNELPAQITELEKQRKPELITITIGANDIDWTKPITNCFLATCGSDTDTNTIDKKLETLSNNLKTMLTRIQDIYNGQPPRIRMTNYYRIVTGGQDTCPQFVGITADEASWLDAQFIKLNKTIETSASNFSSVTVVALNFDSNGLCTYDSWIQGLRAPAPFHPTASGQEVIKDTILEYL